MSGAWSAVRVLLAVGAGVLVVLSTVTDGCDDDEAPSWERCTSPLGNATIEWWGGPVLLPLLLGLSIAVVVWVLLGRAASLWRAASARLDATGDI